jgi:DNA-binding beta-propeller fold protein YncE
VSEEFLHPEREDRTVGRRRLLAGSAAAGTVAAAGCLGLGADGDDADPERAPAVFAFNTGDATVSVIDPDANERLSTLHLGASSSFPANQHAPELTTDPDDHLWLNVDDGVRAVTVGDLSTAATVSTGSGFNWQERTPDGEHVIVSAREPAHQQVRVDAAPDSEAFGEVTGRIDRSDDPGIAGADGPRPCDVSVHPDGEYAYVPDLGADTITVLSVDPFDVVRQVTVDPVTDAEAAGPWMGTVSPDGETLLVEHDEAAGTESVWDLADPAAPTLTARVTTDDGLGERPLTSEIGPDGERGYVFTPGTDDLTVLSLPDGAVETRIDLGGGAFAGTWGPDRETLYAPVRDADVVAAVDPGSNAVVDRIAVGASPYGATAARVRPAPDASAQLLADVAAAGVELSAGGTTYCVGECACGHGERFGPDAE